MQFTTLGPDCGVLISLGFFFYGSFSFWLFLSLNNGGLITEKREGRGEKRKMNMLRIKEKQSLFSLFLCVRVCIDPEPDIQINQTVFWFSNDDCQESPVRQIPVKITENMFCAGSSLENIHTCKVTLFPLPHSSLA